LSPTTSAAPQPLDSDEGRRANLVHCSGSDWGRRSIHRRMRFLFGARLTRSNIPEPCWRVEVQVSDGPIPPVPLQFVSMGNDRSWPTSTVPTITEEEWRNSSDATELLRLWVPRASRRKLRLYLCGGCRQIERLFYCQSSRNAVEVAERAADGLATSKDLSDAEWSAEAATFGYDFEAEFWERLPGDPCGTVKTLVEMGALAESVLTGGEWKGNTTIRDRLVAAAELAWICVYGYPPSPEWFYQAAPHLGWPGRWLVDCIFGNPFWPMSFKRRWESGEVLKLATQIYDERAFRLMPRLGTALKQSGCRDLAILEHCATTEHHARGCWVIDVILGKT
jgi:hypothetical protein